MKKIIIFLILIMFISLGFNLYFLNIKISDNNLKTDEKIAVQCSKAIKGEVSDKIKNTNIYKSYVKSFKFINEGKKTYLDFKYIKEKNCNLLDLGENKKLCELVKSKDLKGLNRITEEGTFENILIKSFIEEKNNCNLLKDFSRVDECNTNFYDYKNFDNLVINTNMGLSIIAVGKELNVLGKNKFIEKLNKEFLEKCNNL